VSIFASETTSDPIPIPGDEPNWVVVRALTGQELEAAAEANRGQVQSGSARAWPATLRRMLEFGASDPDVLKAVADPLLGYDRVALVRAGLVAWSYPHKIAVRPEGGDLLLRQAEQKERDKHIADLRDEPLEFVAKAALRQTKPALFLTTVQDVEVEKKSD